MGAPRYGKDMMLFKLFVSSAPTPDPEKSPVAQAFTKMGLRCADCVLCEEHTVEDAAELHERSLDQLLEAINAVPDPKPEESTAWKLAEAVRRLDEEHAQELKRFREEVSAGLAAARATWTAHSKPPVRRGEGLFARMLAFLRPQPKAPGADEKIWQAFEKMLAAQAEYDRKRASLVGPEFGAALDETIIAMMLHRPGLPDVLPLVFPGLQRHPEERQAWTEMIVGDPPAPAPVTEPPPAAS